MKTQEEGRRRFGSQFNKENIVTVLELDKWTGDPQPRPSPPVTKSLSAHTSNNNKLIPIQTTALLLLLLGSKHILNLSP